MPIPPDCSIEFKSRPFSLPFGVPPAITQDNRLLYFLDMQCQCRMFTFNGQTACGYDPYDDPLDDPLDPGIPTEQKFKVITGSGKNPLIPHTMNLPGTIQSTDFSLSKNDDDPRLIPITYELWKPVTLNGAGSLIQAEAARFCWGAGIRKIMMLPQPLWVRNSLLVYWKKTSVTGGLLDTPIEGSLANDKSVYALATSTTSRDGELSPVLLRAPSMGLVRFQRYRHILKNSNGALTVSHPSSAGTLVVRSIPSKTPPVESTPLYSDNQVIFDNVNLDSAVTAFASLAYIQLVYLDEIQKTKVFEKDVLAQCRLLLSAWLAYLTEIYPVKNPGAPDLNGQIENALKEPFRKDPTEGKASLKQIIDLRNYIQGLPALRNNFVSFISTYYAPVVCGKSWHELGIDLPKDPRPPSSFQAILESLPMRDDIWLVCYAGAPLGEAAKVYGINSISDPAVERLPLQAYSVFELEALIIAGKVQVLYQGVTIPSTADSLIPINLGAFDSKAIGWLTGIRLLHNKEYTVRYSIWDWLSEVVKGSNFEKKVEAQVNLDYFSQVVHPLGQGINYDEFSQGKKYRAAMDELRTAGLDLKIINWWKQKTDLTDSQGRWPTYPVGADAMMSPAGPVDSFKGDITQSNRLSSGFDAFDLESALVAQNLVRDPQGAKIPLAVFLALLRTEGYCYMGEAERCGILIDKMARRLNGWKYLGEKAVPDPNSTSPTEIYKDPEKSPSLITLYAEKDWIIFPWGLDALLNEFRVNTVGPPSGTPEQYYQRNINYLRASFRNRITKYKNENLLVPLVNEFYLQVYLKERISSQYDKNNRMQAKRINRRLQWLGMAIQQAEFQMHHKLLQNSGQLQFQDTEVVNDKVNVVNYDVSIESVDEFTMKAVPLPGPNANSPERRKFIAYYAAIYLYFNTTKSIHPKYWNNWVQKAKQAKPANMTVSEYLLYTLSIPTPPNGPDRFGFQKANMLRFSVALDAYLRMNIIGPQDLLDPAARTGW